MDKKLQRHQSLTNSPLLLSREAITEIISRIEANVLDEEAAANFFDWGYDAEKGVLPIRGALAQRPDIIHMYLGGSSVDLLMKHFQALMSDDSVSRIVLDIDSPGGYVNAISTFSDMIYQSRGKKEIIASVNSMATSAAYWIASAADSVIMSDPTAMAGSIGVYIAHIDVSKAEEKWGIKTTEITAGRYKSVASPYKPLSDEGKETLQARADYIYSLFVDAVARNRGLKTANIAAWADGKIFVGQQAIEVGLADNIQSFETIIGAIDMTEPKTAATPPQAPEITEAYLAANYAPLLAKIKTSSYEEGMKSERERVMAIETLEKAPAFAGFSAVFTKAKAEGWTEAETNKALVKEQMDRGISLQEISQDATQAGNFSGNVSEEENAVDMESLKRAVKAAEASAGRRR